MSLYVCIREYSQYLQMSEKGVTSPGAKLGPSARVVRVLNH